LERGRPATNRRRIEDGGALAPECYVSPAFHALEIERIFRREWLCLARADEIPNAGDYLGLEVAGEPVLVVRDQAGAVRVLSAVCRHRSMPVARGRGNARVLVCPYHAWSYALDGRLVAAPGMERAHDFDVRRCRLPEVRSEIWEGFVFASFDPGARALAPSLAGLSARLKNYRVAEMRVVRSIPFDFECPWNWKLWCDNYMEWYHHMGAHRASLEPSLPARLGWAEEPDGPYAVAHMRYRAGALEEADRYGLRPRLPVIGTLSADERQRVSFVHIYPSTLLAFCADHMEFYRLSPEGPARTRLEKLYCAHPEAAAAPGFEAAVGDLVAGFTAFRAEDVAICAAVQRSYGSRYAGPAPLSHMERPVADFARYVRARTSGRAVRRRRTG
ncbi:MAG: aromatic ring-hydroxylating oxygenase subunit alpha, partial [Alphaproteobacteria bacterium]